MQVINTAVSLRKLLDVEREKGHAIGFVPTMGALHPGHISLIANARSENDKVVASIFVNPTQFNDKSDLEKYPRTPQADHVLLEHAGCDIVFTPSVEEMYPDFTLLDMDFGWLEQTMEGKFRPGHFKGMATVVSRFFDIIQPHRAYFGEKDFQQLAIIRELVKRQQREIEIVGCETSREPDGLAMSSRNIHLTPEERKLAPVIFKALTRAAGDFRKGSPHTRQDAITRIESESGFSVQYFELVDSETLMPAEHFTPSIPQRICTAVLTSRTRLIDNVAV